MLDIDPRIVDEVADELFASHWDDLVFPGEEDECAEPADWDAGNVCFDPYV